MDHRKPLQTAPESLFALRRTQLRHALLFQNPGVFDARPLSSGESTLQRKFQAYTNLSSMRNASQILLVQVKMVMEKQNHGKGIPYPLFRMERLLRTKSFRTRIKETSCHLFLRVQHQSYMAMVQPSLRSRSKDLSCHSVHLCRASLESTQHLTSLHSTLSLTSLVIKIVWIFLQWFLSAVLAANDPSQLMMSSASTSLTTVLVL